MYARASPFSLALAMLVLTLLTLTHLKNEITSLKCFSPKFFRLIWAGFISTNPIFFNELFSQLTFPQKRDEATSSSCLMLATALALEFKMSLVRIPDTNAKWFAVAHIEFKHILWLKIRRYAFGMNKLITIAGFRILQLVRKKTTPTPDHCGLIFYFSLRRNTWNKNTTNKRTISLQIVYFNTITKWKGTL